MVAAEWLDAVRSVRTTARAQSQGWWFPLVALGLSVLSVSWLYLPLSLPTGRGEDMAALLAGPAGRGHVTTGSGCLAVAIAVAYAASGTYYLAASRRRGLVRRMWYWMVPALLLLLFSSVTSGATLSAMGVPGRIGLPSVMKLSLYLPDLFSRGTGPLLAVALALPLLSWVERSPRLAWFSLLMLGMTLLASLYDLENLLGAPGMSAGGTVGVALIGGVLVAGGLAGRLPGGLPARLARRSRGPLVPSSGLGLGSSARESFGTQGSA
ncbi:MAG: hypothetical protein ACYDH5_14310 [Acidimicrobiales bacterium]